MPELYVLNKDEALSTNLPFSTMDLPSSLERIRQDHDSVLGLVAEENGQEIFCNVALTKDQISTVNELLEKLRLGYESTQRKIHDFVFGFSSCDIIAVVEKSTIIWALLRRGDSDLDKIRTALRQAVSSTPSTSPPPNLPPLNPEPDSVEEEVQEIDENWSTLEPHLLGALTKVIGSAQAERIIERQLKEFGFEGDQKPSGQLAEQICLKIIAEVPNRSKRKVLQAEFIDVIKKL